jgi:hypothetical protein
LAKTEAYGMVFLMAEHNILVTDASENGKEWAV